MCVQEPANGPDVRRLLDGLPTNWGKWGPDDEAGALNYLQSEQVMRGIAAVRQGRTFTLQVDIGHAPVNPLVIK
ncbi:hypothetical protein [Burkholderia cenocepacia]|uniref:hypothetical protein n=1 Tax=Burkholderia cenocepacia TaxID=95486 RepID=UPI002011C40B|nr:hypothetical protein [Burkholderia cenocepacia]